MAKKQSQTQDDVVAYAQRLKEYGIKGMEHHGILRRRERSIQYRMALCFSLTIIAAQKFSISQEESPLFP